MRAYSCFEIKGMVALRCHSGARQGGSQAPPRAPLLTCSVLRAEAPLGSPEPDGRQLPAMATTGSSWPVAGGPVGEIDATLLTFKTISAAR